MNDELTIFVDDDKLSRMGWKYIFSRRNLKLEMFSNKEDFIAWFETSQDTLKRDTNFCFDLDLQGSDEFNYDGFKLAEIVYNSGFERIYICSSYEKEEVGDLLPSYVIMEGKEPPKNIIGGTFE